MKRKSCLLLVSLLIFSLALLPLGGETVEAASGSSPGTIRLNMNNSAEEEKGSLQERIYDQIYQQLEDRLNSRYSSEVVERIADQVMEQLQPRLERIFEDRVPEEEEPQTDPPPSEEEEEDKGRDEDESTEPEDPPVDEEEPSFEPGDNVAAMLELVNQARVNAGVQPLELYEELSEVAQLKAEDMDENNYFSHQSPRYGSPFDMMRDEGISFRYAGENLALAPTVESAHENLMNSPGHRRNILNERFTHIGIGAVETNRGLIFVQMFMHPN